MRFVPRRLWDVLLGFVRRARRGAARGDARASVDPHAHGKAEGLVRRRRLRNVSSVRLGERDDGDDEEDREESSRLRGSTVIFSA